MSGRDKYPEISDGVPNSDPVVAEAMRRWKRAEEWESYARSKFVEDLKFRHGDSENNYQWHEAIRDARDGANKPYLTMNMVQQHNLQISNGARKNKSSVKFMATGGDATQRSADVFRDLWRYTEYQSNAQAAYTLASNFQIDAGFGCWRLTTEYADPESFDLEIRILPVIDPLAVYFDPDAQDRACYSDGEYGFNLDTMPKDEFEDSYPKYVGLASLAPLGAGSMLGDDWVSGKDVRVCEYFRKVHKQDTLVSFVHLGERHTLLKSKMPKALLVILDDPQTKTRPTEAISVEWKLIVGQQVIDETVWPGKYIPLVPVIGQETRIEGILDRKGHTRAMKDAQRMYNYNASAQVEFGALQAKTPWTAPAEAIEEYEEVWATANTENPSILPYKAFSDTGEPIPPPQRVQPPTASPLFQQGMDTAANQMMMTSGQYQNQLGMQGNERTGAAIGKRQEQSDTAVFHFQDNYAMALQYTGKMFIDLVPKVYDTKRTLRIIAEDGSDSELVLDPGAKQSLQETLDGKREVVSRIFNPTVGRYDVASTVGPAYDSKREQTTEALTLILSQNPGLTGVVGDILLASMDFDKASEASLRMRRMVPKQALGEGPSAEEQALQQQVQQLQGLLEKALGQNAKDHLKLIGKDQMRDIDVYEAETGRIQAVSKLLPTNPDDLKRLIHSTVGEALQTHLQGIVDENKQDDDGEGQIAKDTVPTAEEQTPGQPGGSSPVPAAASHPLGARQAPDGEFYLLDPTRKGKYLHVGPLVGQGRPGR